MKIKIKRLFRYQLDARTVKELKPGVYDVGRDISQHLCDSVLRFGKAEIVMEKKAPENKVVKAPESKAKVGKVRRSRPRPKPIK